MHFARADLEIDAAEGAYATERLRHSADVE